VVEFAGDVTDIPGGEKLSFFDIERSAGFGTGLEEVGLSTEEGGDLEEIDGFGGNFRFLGCVDVGGDRDTEFFANFSENSASLDNAGATEGVNRGSVGFIVGGFGGSVPFAMRSLPFPMRRGRG